MRICLIATAVGVFVAAPSVWVSLADTPSGVRRPEPVPVPRPKPRAPAQPEGEDRWRDSAFCRGIRERGGSVCNGSEISVAPAVGDVVRHVVRSDPPGLAMYWFVAGESAPQEIGTTPYRLTLPRSTVEGFAYCAGECIGHPERFVRAEPRTMELVFEETGTGWRGAVVERRRGGVTRTDVPLAPLPGQSTVD